MRCPADVYKPSVRLIAASENSLIPSMIEPYWSFAAGEFVFSARKSISALPSRVRRWASKKSTTVSAGQLHGPRSRLHRFGGEDSATPKQPFWPKSVSYVLGTFCKGSLRTVHFESGAGDGNRIASHNSKDSSNVGVTDAPKVNSFHLVPSELGVHIYAEVPFQYDSFGIMELCIFRGNPADSKEDLFPRWILKRVETRQPLSRKLGDAPPEITEDQEVRLPRLPEVQ
jgi:hypothetical protein